MEPSQSVSLTWSTWSASKENNPAFDPKEVDAMLANSLNSLSFRDRSIIQEEVHGVRSLAPEETPEMVAQAFLDLQEEIDKLPSNSKTAYDRSISLDSSFVRSNDFRIKFLRAELFDAKKAALRFTIYLKLAHKYFGDVALMRPLYFEDLSLEEQEETREGVGQILPSRDRSGRLIQFYQQNVLKHDGKLPPLANRMRHGIYEAGLLSGDAETQRKGFCGIYDIRADSVSFNADPHERETYSEFLKGYPVRWSSIHLILPAEPIYPFVKAIMMMTLGNEQRLRTCFYSGYNMETKYKLMCFGINVAELPLTSSGAIKNKAHNQFLSVLRTVEKGKRDGLNTSGWVLHPGVYDVLFSKGGNRRHQGNLNFHCIMELKMDAYNSKSSRKEGKLIREEMIRMVNEKGGRFLELNKDGGYWTEITGLEALHAKINTSMRDHNRRLVARGMQQSLESETSRFLSNTNKRQKLADDRTTGCCL